jgi:stage II sporulation protein D
MKHVVTAALSAVLILFLIPLLAFGGAQAGESPSPVATLPPDPGPAITKTAALKDAERVVHLLLEGDQVVELNLADYLNGVVAAEMPASFEYEALKAQAVAARTYAWYRLEHPSADHPEADLCSDSGCCQAYIDPAAAAVNWGADALTNSRKIAAAVEDTDGLVILYEDEPIQALFHSSSAGRTLDAV